MPSLVVLAVLAHKPDSAALLRHHTQPRLGRRTLAQGRAGGAGAATVLASSYVPLSPDLLGRG